MLDNIKIMFIDLDGTLLNNKIEITDYSKKIISKIIDRGIYVILCSGRGSSDITEKSKAIKSTPIIISDNGAMVFDYKNDIEIYESKIKKQTIEDIWNLALNNNMNVTFNSKYKRFKSCNSSKEGIVINDIKEIDKSVTQIVIDTNDYESIVNLKNLIESTYHELQVKNFHEGKVLNDNQSFFEIDIFNKNNSKGKAINKLFNYLNIDKKYSICFGDQMNDLEMFENCNVKVAMCNGNEKLKEKADFITTYNNDEDGVSKFIEKYIL